MVSFQGLGDLAGDDFYSFGYALSGDGSVAVGMSHSSNGFEAFRWNGSPTGLGDELCAGRERTLTEARAISDDGLTIAGFGINPDGDTEGWITTISAIPEPSTALLLGMGLALLARCRRS